jgi:CLIP-associating protein 1/2
MSNLDLFLPLLGTTDVRKKILIGDDIIAYLSSPDNPPKCEDIGLFIDGLVSWINNSNFKVNFLIKHLFNHKIIPNIAL